MLLLLKETIQMKLTYQNELYELRKWLDNTNAILKQSVQILRLPQEVHSVQHWISVIATSVQSEYPFYAAILPKISSILFQVNNMGVASLNLVAFGELMVIIQHIQTEPFAMRFWSVVHTRVVSVSFELYNDGHYASAAENAVKEVETRLREKFVELKPGAPVPSKVGDIIGALISENGAFRFCDVLTTSGKNYRRGVQSLFEGTMAAYRNPSTHANLQNDKRKAMEQIMLASQLMFVLDKPQM